MISISGLIGKIFKKYKFHVPLFLRQRRDNYLLNRFTMQPDNGMQKLSEIDYQYVYKNNIGLSNASDNMEYNDSDLIKEMRAIDIISQYNEKNGNEKLLNVIKDYSISTVHTNKEGIETAFDHITKPALKNTDKSETVDQNKNRGNGILENRNQIEETIELQHRSEKSPIYSLLKKAAFYQNAGLLTIDTSLAARQAVDSKNLKALTIGNTILLGSNYTNIENIRTREILAHEMRHVEQFLTSSEGTYSDLGKIKQLEDEAGNAQNEVLSDTQSSVKKRVPDFTELNSPEITVAYSAKNKGNPKNQLSDALSQKTMGNNYPIQKAIRNQNSIFNNEITHSFEHRDFNLPSGLLKGAEVFAKHGLKASVPVNVAPSVFKMPTVSAKSSALPAMAASEEGTTVAQEKSSSISNNSELDLDSLTEELYQRISDRLVTERERFMK